MIKLKHQPQLEFTLSHLFRPTFEQHFTKYHERQQGLWSLRLRRQTFEILFLRKKVRNLVFSLGKNIQLLAGENSHSHFTKDFEVRRADLELFEWVVIVAQRQSTRLVIRRLWLRIQPGAGLFSSSIFAYFPSPMECSQSGPSRRCISNRMQWKKKQIPSCAAWGETGSISSDWVLKNQKCLVVRSNILKAIFQDSQDYRKKSQC